MKKILIIIPAFNEEQNIKNVIQEVRQISLPNFAFDAIVVCDGTEDKTSLIAQEMNVPVISHSINLGAGAAIQTGLKYALSHGSDMAVVVDGDGQHNPNEVAKLIEAMDDRAADVIIGSRFLSGAKVRTGWARRVGIKLFSVIVSVIGRCKVTDVTSGFRAFNRRTIELLSREIPADFPDADLLLFLALSKYKIEEVSVASRERQGGESMFSFLRSIYYPFKLMVALLGVILRVMAETRRSK